MPTYPTDNRILIIGADLATASDLIRAQRLVQQFTEDAVTYNKGCARGSRHGIAYGRDDTVMVWRSSARQITVKFCGRDNT